MSNISAKVIADSISPTGDRLVSLECKFHRFILPEVNTHRIFSKSASSNRAIPYSRLREEVAENPAVPIYWGENKAGMQSGKALPCVEREAARLVWLDAREGAMRDADRLNDLGVHKEVVNRILEPYSWQTMLITGTQWENFLRLRTDSDAQPEMRALALEIQEAIDHSVSTEVNYGEWHLPYITKSEQNEMPTQLLKMISAARCARTSYLSGKEYTENQDLKLFNRLMYSKLPHSVPSEHVASPAVKPWFRKKSIPGNFNNWKQFRHEVEDGLNYTSSD